jgi:hypothetical protein
MAGHAQPAYIGGRPESWNDGFKGALAVLINTFSSSIANIPFFHRSTFPFENPIFMVHNEK